MEDFAKKLQEAAALEMETNVIAGGTTKKGGITALAHGRTDVLRLNPYTVQIEPGFNIRDPNAPHNARNIETLAREIMAVGQNMPITVQFDNIKRVIYVRDGHTRLLAIRYANEHLGAKIEYILARTSGEKPDRLDFLLKTLSTNGFDPTVLEKAAMVRRICREHNIPVNEVAKRLGMHPNRVNTWVEWDALLTPQMRALVEEGRVTISACVKTIKELGDVEAANEAIMKADHDTPEFDQSGPRFDQGNAAPEAKKSPRKMMPKDIRKAFSKQAPPTLKELVGSIFRADAEHEIGTEIVTLRIDRATFDALRVHAGRVNRP